MKRSLKLASGCAATLFAASTMWSMQRIHAQEPTVEEELHIHRLKSDKTAPYDAFAYLNRLPAGPTEGETPVTFAGNVIFSRLSNMEGRIQIKEVKGFGMPEYLGYKSFLRAWPDEEGIAVGNCIGCHTPPQFQGTDAQPAPSLRDLKKSDEELKKIIQQKIAMGEKARAGDTKIDEAYKLVALSEEDVNNLVAFLQGLNQVEHDEFRQIIVDATILDTSGMNTI